MFSKLQKILFGSTPVEQLARDDASSTRSANRPSTGNQSQGTIVVVDNRGTGKNLTAPIARGGEGTIHRVTDNPHVLVKLYHPAVLSDRDRALRLERKINDMTGCEPLKKHTSLAWPRLSLYRQDGNWCGYAMFEKSGVSLRELCGNPANLARLAPRWHRQHLVALCVNFLDTISDLGQHRALPVDFNPSNFLINLKSHEINMIDCDGFQFQGASGLHFAEALVPELAGPELLGRSSWSAGPVSPNSLRFSIAMILFYILTVGNSPYRHRNGQDPVSNLLSGNCALGKGTRCQLPKGSTYTIWSHLIFDLKALFIQTFRDGHSNPAVRPTIRDWRLALMKYNHCLSQRHSDASIIPAAPKAHRNHA